MKETFGEYIHKLRVDNGLTLTKLAAALDIDQSTPVSYTHLTPGCRR